MKSIYLSLLFAGVVFVLFDNCSGSKNEEEAESDMHSDHDQSADAMHGSADSLHDMSGSHSQFEVEATFQKQLDDVFTAYISLKDGFVASDPGAIRAAAQATREKLSSTDMKLLSGAAHHDWMNYLGEMETALKEMEGSSDLELQRKSFSALSDNLYKSIKAYGLGGETAYYEFCPMAFNNKGGFWLSKEEAIKNPYFGDKMPTCGEVRETLQ